MTRILPRPCPLLALCWRRQSLPCSCSRAANLTIPARFRAQGASSTCTDSILIVPHCFLLLQVCPAARCDPLGPRAGTACLCPARRRTAFAMRSTAKGDPGLVFYLFVRAFTWFEPASFVFLLAVASWLGCRCGLVALWWRCCGEYGRCLLNFE